MTDRYNALTVVLEKDLRDDDAEALLNAIQQLRGVLRIGREILHIFATSLNLRRVSELART